MSTPTFMEVVRNICRDDPRYDADAYVFLREALDFTIDMMNKPREGSEVDRHISGKELLEGIRTYAVQEFGPMSYQVLSTWGIKRTDDFGEIVFNLVEGGQLGRSDKDRREDFANGYSFSDAFVKPFLPRTPRTKTASPAAGQANNNERLSST